MEEFERKLHDDSIPMKVETSIIKKVIKLVNDSTDLVSGLK